MEHETGKFIARKRKEKNMTQEQLAEKLHVSNKTVSKWETGKSMPDYSVIRSLCGELDITVSELLDGKEADIKPSAISENQNEIDLSNDKHIMELLRRTQELQKQQSMLYGIMLIVLGIAMQALSYMLNGSDFRDFLSGLLLGISIVEMLAGVFVVGKGLRR